MKMIALAGLTLLLWPTLTGGGEKLLDHPLAGPALGMVLLAGLLYEPRKGFSGGNVIAGLMGLFAFSMVGSVVDANEQVPAALSSALVGEIAVLAAVVGGLMVMVKGPKKHHKGHGHKGHH